MIVIGLELSLTQNRSVSAAYDADILSAAAIAAAVSIYFTLYGLAMFLRMRRAVATLGGDASLRRARAKLLRVHLLLFGYRMLLPLLYIYIYYSFRPVVLDIYIYL